MIIPCHTEDGSQLELDTTKQKLSGHHVLEIRALDPDDDAEVVIVLKSSGVKILADYLLNNWDDLMIGEDK